MNQNEVKAARKELELTTAQLAKEMGVSRQTITRWEAGTLRMSKSNATHLALLLGIWRTK